MRRLFFVLFLTLSVAFTTAFASRPDVDTDVLPKPGQFRPLPRSTDSFWRDSVPESMRRSYIECAEPYMGLPWESLPATLFAEFKANGNRTRYEKACFDKRTRLALLAMAEVMEGEGRFVGDIVDGLLSHCEETWWGLPAHYGSSIPVPGDQNVDLFNAETAGMLAWIRYVMEPQLEASAPGICRRIDAEISRRILQPALKKNYWWKTAGMNWNPWICSNWLACILICEKDRDRMAEGVGQVMAAMEAFEAAYPDDGGCDEGTGYWDRAAASLFECIRLLDAAAGGRAVSVSPKARRMMEYIYKMYIGKGYCVNFADAHSNRMQAQPDIVLPMALWLGDSRMEGFAAHIAQENNLTGNPAALYVKSGNFPAFGRELFMLRSISAALELEPREPLLSDVWLADLQIMAARRGSMYVAVKGGTNGESHNHNDVGSFIVYASGEPLIVDVGVGEYTAATFGKDRYSIWTMQSAYHNLPEINGTAQKEGKNYAAKVVGRKAGELTLDIAGAYPKEAEVRSWRRTVRAKAAGIDITEAYELGGHKAPTRLVLITPCRPVMSEAGRIDLGGGCIEYDARQMEPSVEDIGGMMDALLRGVWGDRMYRIVLTVKSDALSGKVKYRIKAALSPRDLS